MEWSEKCEEKENWNWAIDQLHKMECEYDLIVIVALVLLCNAMKIRIAVIETVDKKCLYYESTLRERGGERQKKGC